MKTSLILILLYNLLLIEIQAQDPQSSLFLANPLYHNPAFTGSSGFSRVSISHRSQYLSLGDFAAYNTQMVSFDTFVEDWNSGFGIQLINDIQGKGFNTKQAALSYSFSHYGDVFRDDGKRRLKGFAGGIQFSYQNQAINGEDLKFVYQYTSNGFDNTISSTSTNALYNSSNVDFSAGVIYSTRGKFDINEPAFVAGVALHRWGINRKITIHFSKTFPLTTDKGEDENTLSFSGYYRIQQGNQQMDLGVNWVKSPLMIGVWYRGMPFLNNNGAIQSDAFYVVGGIQWDRLRLIGSYDLPLSSLKSYGSFEITIAFIPRKDFRLGNHSSKDRSTKCENHGYQWLF
jgi:type IX secretion system PorP/SprF family membrane protein